MLLPPSCSPFSELPYSGSVPAGPLAYNGHLAGTRLCLGASVLSTEGPPLSTWGVLRAGMGYQVQPQLRERLRVVPSPSLTSVRHSPESLLSRKMHLPPPAGGGGLGSQVQLVLIRVFSRLPSLCFPGCPGAHGDSCPVGAPLLSSHRQALASLPAALPACPPASHARSTRTHCRFRF